MIELNFIYFMVGKYLTYSVRTKRNDRTYWRCVDLQCQATAVTVDNILGRPHNHNWDFVGLAADFFVIRVKKRCREEATHIPSIYYEELRALQNADRDDSVMDMIK